MGLHAGKDVKHLVYIFDPCVFLHSNSNYLPVTNNVEYNSVRCPYSAEGGECISGKKKKRARERETLVQSKMRLQV